LPIKANTESAEQTAKTVGGKVAMYYALEKPPIAVDPGLKGLVRAARARAGGATNAAGMESEIANRLEEAKQARMLEMSKSRSSRSNARVRKKLPSHPTEARNKEKDHLCKINKITLRKAAGLGALLR
jgi:hypothetical protein